MKKKNVLLLSIYIKKGGQVIEGLSMWGLYLFKYCVMILWIYGHILVIEQMRYSTCFPQDLLNKLLTHDFLYRSYIQKQFSFTILLCCVQCYCNTKKFSFSVFNCLQRPHPPTLHPPRQVEGGGWEWKGNTSLREDYCQEK